MGRDGVHVRLGPHPELADRPVQGQSELGEFVATVTGTVGTTVRSTSPSRSRDRSVWVSIFWLDLVNVRVGDATGPRPGSFAEAFGTLVELQQQGLVRACRRRPQPWR